jgi:hypothetical protein
MRSPLLSLAVICGLTALTLRGQDAPLPKPETQDPAPEARDAASPVPTPAAPDLIPADILPAPDPAAPLPMPDIPTIEQLDQAMSPPPLSPAAEAHRLHIEWRKLRNQAQNDPRVKAALADADAARTDLERRKRLARYYEIFHARMIALAPPTMKKYLQDRKGEALASLPQPRVRPETAPKPSPTPKGVTAATGSPSPTASPSPTPPSTSAAAYASPSPSPTGSSLMPRLPRP